MDNAMEKKIRIYRAFLESEVKVYGEILEKEVLDYSLEKYFDSKRSTFEGALEYFNSIFGSGVIENE